MQLNKNQEIVLEELKSVYGNEQENFIFDLYHFYDTYRYEKDGSEVSTAYEELSNKEVLEVVKCYIEYLETRESTNALEA